MASGRSGRVYAIAWWSVGIVEPLVPIKCVGQVSLVPDEGAVEQFVAAGLYPRLHERVHPRHPGAAEPILLREVACLETLCGKYAHQLIYTRRPYEEMRSCMGMRNVSHRLTRTELADLH